MSVIVSNLTKTFGDQRAVDDLSFEVKPGEILGFLGPNGAGKSTTMKMITTYLQPTSGTATVCGHDVIKDQMDVRRHIGYLPEHNPLYKDMYIKEYLQFVARIHKVDNAKDRIVELIETTGLQKEQHKLISSISKGYRQRVGLAQALLHDPDVIILDEPTSGLDMNQLIEIRALIKKLGETKTVIFSTHIMQEVQALCDRVIIINEGKLVADDPINMLQKRLKGEDVIYLELDKKYDASALESINGVNSVTRVSPTEYTIGANNVTDIRPNIFHLATQQNWVILEMRREQKNVEYIFQQLTKKQNADV
ncbi:MAG TPA: gliding motility-associated ABC transporter ATP-binding subunit GldA [Saprospirales bacterium]|jgi:ABC-2 type transport system ATP-binding protein|nr:gliding motility-associated ABC transporter ATP-binding subunit GldA [Saprospiraceae bacterium]HAV28717.1 gliding motility-associated ABC transporter ATP-binding subunit GldA [Saprospirales bacterium]HAW03744.1 gliding motility-associated ABC transporter ATP-binding subunit GldA [Saprospirales bacterium]